MPVVRLYGVQGQLLRQLFHSEGVLQVLFVGKYQHAGSHEFFVTQHRLQF